MGARKRRGTSDTGWADEVRERIKSSMLINRLIDHALGKVGMLPTQVRAVEILLRKTLPDLASTEHTGAVEHRFVAEVPAVSADSEEWAKQYAPPTIQ